LPRRVLGQGFNPTQWWFEHDIAEDGMVMTIVMTVIVVALRQKAVCGAIVTINVGIVAMVGIVRMKDGCRFLMIQIGMHALYCRPSELEGNDKQEEDGKHATHWLIVPKYDYRWGYEPCPQRRVLDGGQR